jgi:hypothetical protein
LFEEMRVIQSMEKQMNLFLVVEEKTNEFADEGEGMRV